VATWIALFRGINVVGRHVIPMRALAAGLERGGFREVRTYIQSGNAVFRSPMRSPAAIAERIATIVADGHGFRPRIVVLSTPELVAAAAANPFHEANAKPASVHLFFLAAVPSRPNFDLLNRVRAGAEAFKLSGKVLYLFTPDGFGRSKLAAQIERCIRVDATARNWRTVTKLVEMAQSYG